MEKLTFKKLNTDHVTVQGREFAIEDCETGKVYVTCKNYMDKLFKEMGYRSVEVIKILEEFAGKYINSIGSLRDSNIYVDEDTDTFIVTASDFIIWLNNLFDQLDAKGFTILSKKINYYNNDQFIVKSKSGDYFALEVDLVKGMVKCYRLWSESQILKGVVFEGKYKMAEVSDVIGLIVNMETHVDITKDFHHDEQVSTYEFINLLELLKYVEKIRGKYTSTDKGEVELDLLPDLATVVCNANCDNWLRQRISAVPDVTFMDVCALIGKNFDEIKVSDVYPYYENNSSYSSDMSLIK